MFQLDIVKFFVFIDAKGKILECGKKWQKDKRHQGFTVSELGYLNKIYFLKKKRKNINLIKFKKCLIKLKIDGKYSWLLNI